jgi:hypothetical protein
MIDPAPITAIRRFLAIVRDGAPPNTVDRALDRLVVAVHDTPAGLVDDLEATPPKRDYAGEAARMRDRFPGLGAFPGVWPLDPDQEVTTTTADDALADIVGDLDEVVWRYENVSSDDAFWHLHLLFLHHWGVHLRELSFYLHFLLREHGPDQDD